MLHKKAIKFLICNFFYEIFGKFYFSFKKNIYVCVIDYNFFYLVRKRLSKREVKWARIKIYFGDK